MNDVGYLIISLNMSLENDHLKKYHIQNLWMDGNKLTKCVQIRVEVGF